MGSGPCDDWVVCVELQGSAKSTLVARRPLCLFFLFGSGTAGGAAVLVGLRVFALNDLINFLPVHRNLGGGFDAQPDFIAADIDDRNDNIVADDDALVALAGQNKHRRTPY